MSAIRSSSDPASPGRRLTFVMRIRGMTFQPGGAAAAHAAAADDRRRLAAGQVADELAGRHDRDVLGGHALVVVAERAQPAGRRWHRRRCSRSRCRTAACRACRGSGRRCRRSWPPCRARGPARSGGRTTRGPAAPSATSRSRPSSRRTGSPRRSRSATASSAMRCALPARSMARTASKPPVTCCPPAELGQLRTCDSCSLTAVASMPAPASVSSCSMCAPSLEAKVFRSRPPPSSPRGRVTPGTAAMAASASNRSAQLLVDRDGERDPPRPASGSGDLRRRVVEHDRLAAPPGRWPARSRSPRGSRAPPRPGS